MPKQFWPYFDLGRLFFDDFFTELIENSGTPMSRQTVVEGWCGKIHEEIYVDKRFPFPEAQCLAHAAIYWTGRQHARITHLSSLSILYRPANITFSKSGIMTWLLNLSTSSMQIVVDPRGSTNTANHHALCFCYIAHEIGHLTDEKWSLVPSLGVGLNTLLPRSNADDENHADSFANGFITKFNSSLKLAPGQTPLPLF